MSRVKAKTKGRLKTNKDDYVIPPKQKERLEKKLLDFKTLMDKSVDDEATFHARYKEILSLGRQSAKDRLRAGQILIDLEKEIKNLGYPFWPWLAAQFDERIPERTARRAMDIAWHFETVAELGDRTITEALKEAQEAKAKKAEANAQAKHLDDGEDEDSGTGDDVKVGKEPDTVSDSLPISSNPESEDGTAEEDDETADGQLEDDDAEDDDEERAFGQSALQWELDTVRGQIEAILERMAGDLGDFEKPNEIVKEIDYSIDLLNQLKSKVPM